MDYPLDDAGEAKRAMMGVTMLAYSVLLAVGLAVSSPWWLLRMMTTERYREGLRERMGFVPRRLREAVRGFAGADVTSSRVVWVHAVSVGEVLAASRLVGELEAALSGFCVVVSTTTRTGQALARERFGQERVFYFPLDFAWAVRRYLRVLRPAAMVLMESELWPRMLWECERASVPVVVVNARVSDRSFSRAQRWREVWRHVLRRVSLWLVQSEEDARRLVAMGAREGVVRTTGNLKYDVRAPKESRVAELIREVADGRPIVVAGSTVGGTEDRDPDEEGWVITAWASGARNLGALLVIAPRHPERFEMVWKDAIEFPSLRATEMLSQGMAARARCENIAMDATEAEIVLLDTIGDLASVYGVADVAFVGGSLIKRGGHNPLEPAQWSVPIVIGPSFENFRDIVTTMRAAQGLAVVSGIARTPTDYPKKDVLRPDLYVMRDSLTEELIRLLTDCDAARAMGERGRRVFEEQQGATGRAVEAIVAVVRERAGASS